MFGSVCSGADVPAALGDPGALSEPWGCQAVPQQHCYNAQLLKDVLCASLACSNVSPDKRMN